MEHASQVIVASEDLFVCKVRFCGLADILVDQFVEERVERGIVVVCVVRVDLKELFEVVVETVQVVDDVVRRGDVQDDACAVRREHLAEHLVQEKVRKGPVRDCSCLLDHVKAGL